MELAQAKSQGYLKNQKSVSSSSSGKKLLAVIGVYTGFGSHLKRNKFRGSWMPRGYITIFALNLLIIQQWFYFLSSFRRRFEKAWGKRSCHTLCDWSEVFLLTFSFLFFFLLLAMFFSLCLNHMGEIILMLMLYKFSSANRGDSLDRKIDQENLATKDFLILVSKNNPFSYFSFRCLLIWI